MLWCHEHLRPSGCGSTNGPRTCPEFYSRAGMSATNFSRSTIGYRTACSRAASDSSGAKVSTAGSMAEGSPPWWPGLHGGSPADAPRRVALLHPARANRPPPAGDRRWRTRPARIEAEAL